MISPGETEHSVSEENLVLERERREGEVTERNTGVRETSTGCLQHTPGPGLGIEQGTLQSAG